MSYPTMNSISYEGVSGVARMESGEYKGSMFRPIHVQGAGHWDRRHKTPWEVMQKRERLDSRKSKATRQALRTEVFSKIIL